MDITIGKVYEIEKVGRKGNQNSNDVYRGKIVGVRESRSRSEKLHYESRTNSKTLIIVTNSNINKDITGKTVLIKIVN